MLDPCCGSGHFLVNAFNLLVPLRMHDEGLSAREACDAVLRENLFGLELDPRCTQIAAFALALAAWRYPGEDGVPLGYRELPPLNIAACGLAPNASLDEWLRVAERAAAAGGLPVQRDLFGAEQNLLSSRVRAGLEELYRLFQQGPTLGSLLDPATVGGDLLAADFGQLQPLLAAALESETPDAEARELGVAAHGFAKAARLLAGKYTLVATNVPYLGRGKQSDELKRYCEQRYPDAKADLATCFVERCLAFCARSRSRQTSGESPPPPNSGEFGYTGTVALVTPQNWLFLGTYKKLRKRLLEDVSWNVVARLGPLAFEDHQRRGRQRGVADPDTPAAAGRRTLLLALDASDGQDAAARRPIALRRKPIVTVATEAAAGKSGLRSIIARRLRAHALLSDDRDCAAKGSTRRRCPRSYSCFWEHRALSDNVGSCSKEHSQSTRCFRGTRSRDSRLERLDERCHRARRMPFEAETLGDDVALQSAKCDPACDALHGRSIRQQLSLPIVPKERSNLPAIWAFCSSAEFR